MMTQSLAEVRSVTTENELDIRSLFYALWTGKLWVIGMALSFTLLVLMYTFLVKQEWSSVAITERPTVNMLGVFYFQQQFLRNLDIQTKLATNDQPSVMEESYKEFIMQLSSWDTRRDFWLQTDYYKQRMVDNKKANAVLLSELINNIQFMPGDAVRNVHDSIKLIAETSFDSSSLLHQYVAFASERAKRQLNNELKGAWEAFTIKIKEQVKRQEEVARTIFSRRVHNIKQSLLIAEKSNISRIKIDVPISQLLDSEMFLLGRLILQAHLENLEAIGPDFNLDYDQNMAVLSTLNIEPTLDSCFQIYRYLRTPEEPVKRDSPHRVFLMIMWGIVGMFIGAGVALTRRRLY